MSKCLVYEFILAEAIFVMFRCRDEHMTSSRRKNWPRPRVNRPQDHQSLAAPIMSDSHQPEVKFLAESFLWIEEETLCNPNSVKRPHFQLTYVAKMRVRVTLRVRVTPTPTLILAVTLTLTLGVTLVLATLPVNTLFQNPLGQNVRPLVLKKKFLFTWVKWILSINYKHKYKI